MKTVDSKPKQEAEKRKTTPGSVTRSLHHPGCKTRESRENTAGYSSLLSLTCLVFASQKTSPEKEISHESTPGDV